MIETIKLSRIYSQGKFDVKAVDEITSTFKKGEFTSVVGPSGSGKTTFLNCVGGLDKPTAGEVIIDGDSLNNLSSAQIIQYRLKNIGFVFQAYNLIPVLSAGENIEMIMLLQGVDDKLRKERTDELLNQVGLYEMRNRRPSELSGGQQQRVAIGRALAVNPSAILMDEPFSNLDFSLKSILSNEVKKIIRSTGTTTIMVTHDEKEAERLSDECYLLENGKIKSI